MKIIIVAYVCKFFDLKKNNAQFLAWGFGRDGNFGSILLEVWRPQYVTS